VHRSAYNSHTTTLFRESKVLKFEDLYKFEVGKFVYDAMHNNLPKPLSIRFNPNSVMHDHYTRQRNNPHVEQRRSMVANNSIIHKAPVILSHIPQRIRDLNSRNTF
jgi:hypothetical protein